MNTRIFITVLVLLSASVAAASDVLGPAFESQVAGISFRAPAGTTQIRKAQTDEIVQYIDESRGWVLKVSRLQLSKPIALTSSKDADGTAHPGLIDLTVEQIRSQSGSIDVIRQDVANTAKFVAGMISVRYTAGTGKHLTQEALIEASDQLYYIFKFTTPAGAGGAEAIKDPIELEASDVFRQIIDSVQLLDRGAIKEDQDQRLFRTRTLLLSFSEAKMKEVLVPEQYLRLQLDGKDIGYTYVVEEVGRRNNNEGVLIGVRARTSPEVGTRVDAESWLFCAFDRKHEEWNTIGVVDKGKAQKDYVSEFGTTDKLVRRVLDTTLTPGDKHDPHQPPVRPEESYVLNVTRTAKTKTGEPLTRDLPPFYLPQALGHLLPRLIPAGEAKSYLFATYVSEQREIMLRYIDVGREEEVTLGDKTFRAVPVKDRIGIEGSATTHYVSLEGKYLGSRNEDSKITILPSDAATLQKLWKDVDLSRPKESEAK